jgi:hypothetical protein
MLWGDYIYLDSEERRRFVSSAHEYLIEQIQYTTTLAISSGATSASLPIEFNHPLKELFWFIQREDMKRYHEFFNYSSLGIFEQGTRRDILQDTVLQLDGFDRFQLRDAGYFRLIQPWQYHKIIPNNFYTYSYSFALDPESVQPCGSLNASRMDSIVLQVNLVPAVVTQITALNLLDSSGNSRQCPSTFYARVYAINYNVLRIVDGFGGVLFTI